MKRCPTCNQTYDDIQAFCAADGTQLIEQPSQPTPPAPTIVSAPLNQPYSAPQQFTSAPTPPRKSKALALASLILGCIASTLMIYLAAQTLLSPYRFRARYVSMWTLGFSGIALTLGLLLTCLAVIVGIVALILSFTNKQRFGGRLAAVIGPVVCVLASALGIGLFTYRRIQGPPTYYSTYPTYSPSYSTNSNSNSNSSPRSYSPASMTDEEKYRLFYAATKTEDKFLQSEAAKKIGIIDADGKPTPSYQTFLKNATSWAMNDTTFIKSIDTPAKARTYVNAHMDY